MDHFCYLCFVFVMLSCMLIAALWSLAGKGLTFWLSCSSMWCFVVFLSLSIWCPGLGVVLDCVNC